MILLPPWLCISRLFHVDLYPLAKSAAVWTQLFTMSPLVPVAVTTI
jgi:hypothetical protein